MIERTKEDIRRFRADMERIRKSSGYKCVVCGAYVPDGLGICKPFCKKKKVSRGEK